MDFCKLILASAVAALAFGSGSVVLASDHAPGVKASVPRELVDAQQARQQILDFEMAPVHSAEDLAAYLRSANARSPLMRLSPGARERFIEGLTFNENGLVAYRYEDLARELTASQAYRVLGLFGAQRTTHLLGARIESRADAAASSHPPLQSIRATDYKDYRCSGPHNCYAATFYICLAGC